MGQVFGGMVRPDSAVQKGNGPVRVVGNGEAIRQAAGDLPAGPRLDMNTGEARPAPIAPDAARVVTPSFAEASRDGLTSPGLTNKGRLLGLLLTAGQGAALGYGEPTFSKGFAKAQRYPLDMQELEQDREKRALEIEARRRELERGPSLFDQNRRLVDSQIAANQARGEYARERGEAVNRPVVGGRIVNREDGTVVYEREATPRLFGNPNQGIVQVNPDGTTKELRPANPKPVMTKPPKATKQQKERPVYVNGEIVGYTADGKTMRPEAKKPSMRQYVVNGKAYAIPENEVDAFLADYPNAKQATRRPLTEARAAQYLEAANGDRTKARKMAKEDGWEF